ncbi:helix-hairpin-helix domain-containing protein [Flavobacterium sp. F372]|jgi:DNA uptake protein ComE-like DNA-binding protein|uniref:Helix-hairpin-helix domain-containing protein n=1 Tax=Flavobacterium bernardetii TaxID=2813823 RepID=A0ABR7IXY4_9FLAO|nr:helix-hairpin-helix domain-containing protein [Flavobacterium bernardetii]MBC5834578.1 helix-hairpin-helix domain-containing protein [Flavobacterium bernardetii]NHF70226.1 helix-hairpin-helix domain-containing protein [Flavobacterium bernardetii]
MIKFSKGHYFGIAILLILIGMMQLYYYWSNNQSTSNDVDLSKEDKKWLLQQNGIDSLKEVTQENAAKIYPFNPNFISDYKGYKLGMTVEQIDKLHNLRKQNKYVNSKYEFQKLTGVSNDWMKKYAIYFKFPEWVTNKSANKFQSNFENKFQKYEKKETKIVVQDINTANQVELEKVYMIGEKLALKIIAEREKFGGFADMEQISFIWGISLEAIADLNKRFQIKSTGNLKKIKINELPIKELQQFPYFNYYIAKNIVTYRSMNGEIKNIEDLTNVKQFPVEKLKIIAVYLEF